MAITIYVRLAQHFEKLKQLPEAESLFIMAKLPSEAVRMYLKQKKYEAAQKVILCTYYIFNGRFFLRRCKVTEKISM